jgi:hypothetical protein
MKYLCLVYADEKTLTAVPDEHCVDFDTKLRSSGQCIASEALQPVQTATTVRVRDGEISITDGPFAETKEQLTGFYLVEAEDLDEALRLAAQIPPARVGSIEVRPVRPIRETVRARAAGESGEEGS